MRPIVNMPEEDRAMDIGNTHEKFVKDRACGSGDILADRQRDRQTHRQTHSSQYCSTGLVVEVKIRRLHGDTASTDFTVTDTQMQT